jgi:hypothetical protein
MSVGVRRKAATMTASPPSPSRHRPKRYGLCEDMGGSARALKAVLRLRVTPISVIREADKAAEMTGSKIRTIATASESKASGGASRSRSFVSGGSI